MIRALLSHRFIRFCLVGGFNTAVDMAIYLALRSLGVALLLALIVSTAIGLLVGYRLHTSFTFKQNRAKFIRFLTISLIGLWIIQPIIAAVSEVILTSSLVAGVLVWFIAKLIATASSMTWNYSLYRKFVYKADSQS